ncbi:phage tail assembly protein [Pseudoxanthomonas sp. UTMC 1351]|uniref:phage tail assembly protein n=1 Tax=Pseudoxanthomonas sp. UTMC 1351 TaxID=2695853 RepID=UPI0034CD73B2
MERLTKTGTLVHGLKVGEQVHKEFELREALAGDYFAAEGDATGARPMTYRAALVARQLVRMGTFQGPFTLEMISKLKGADLSRLLTVQQELDREGEDEQLGD